MRQTHYPQARSSRPTFVSVVRMWPWRVSVIAWLVVVVLVGLVRHRYTGIYGFSTANYGWLAFTIFGGSVLAWRLAGRPPFLWGMVRPLLVAAIAFVLCAIAVALMGVIFLPSHPLQGGGDTEGPLWGALHPLGRALPVAMIVVVVGYVAELLRGVWAHARRTMRNQRQ